MVGGPLNVTIVDNSNTAMSNIHTLNNAIIDGKEMIFMI